MKQPQGLWSVVLRLLRNVVLIDLGIFGIVGLFCWLIGWRTWFQYGRTLVIAGALCALFGVLTMQGAMRSRHPDYFYVDSMGMPSAYERTKQLVLDSYASYRFMVLMGLAGVIVVLVGFVITNAVLNAPLQADSATRPPRSAALPIHFILRIRRHIPICECLTPQRFCATVGLQGTTESTLKDVFGHGNAFITIFLCGCIKLVNRRAVILHNFFDSG